ncbi:MAG: nucleoid-structuring protein H-NS, partial [Clostridiales bacterium]|nr:nucleoid-structuring protein H-NS [Clostridiales bacterium]
RGAGNCPIENVIGFLRNPKYNIYPVIKFIEEYMEPLRAGGVKWGYDIQYLLSGLFNLHPRDAIRYSKEGRTDITNFYKEITSNDN